MCLFSQSSKQMAMEGDKASIPRDIIVDILKRLPVKSLIRFRSVCKDWKNLFNTPSFIADHLHHSAHENPLLLLHRLHRGLNSLSLCLLNREMNILGIQNTSWINSLKWVAIVGSSKGLLCVRHKDGGSPDSLFIWNPAIREVRQVPRTINEFKGISDTGFGFSPVVNDYKIVRIYFPHIYDENGDLVLNRICVNRVEVYSLSTGSWKEVEFGNIQSVSLKSERVVVNGAMFWLGSKMGSWHDDDYDLVVSFDIAIEVFTLVPMPAFASKSRVNDKLTVYENKLALLSNFVIGNFETSLIDLWVMECATGESWSWTKKYAIGPLSSRLSPLSIWRNKIVCMGYERSELIDETEREVRYDRERAVLSMLNPTTNELKKLATDSYALHYIIFNHTESLVPVGNIQIADPGS